MANFNNLSWDINGSWLYDKNPSLDANERRQGLLFLEKKVLDWGFIHRAQNSPLADENRPSESLNSLYSRIDLNYNLEDIEQRFYATDPSSRLIQPLA